MVWGTPIWGNQNRRSLCLYVSLVKICVSQRENALRCKRFDRYQRILTPKSILFFRCRYKCISRSSYIFGEKAVQKITFPERQQQQFVCLFACLLSLVALIVKVILFEIRLGSHPRACGVMILIRRSSGGTIAWAVRCGDRAATCAGHLALRVSWPQQLHRLQPIRQCWSSAVSVPIRTAHPRTATAVAKQSHNQVRD